MDLKALYLDRLNDSERAEFCRVAKTTDSYMRVHLVRRAKIPRPALMQRLVRACNEAGEPIAHADLLAWFYNRPSQTANAEPGAGRAVA